MKTKTQNPTQCPACSHKSLLHHNDDQTGLEYWRCEGCGQAYSDAAGTPGDRLPLSLHQAAGIVAIAQKHPDLFGIKKALNNMGKESIWAMCMLKQAVDEGFLKTDPKTGNFLPTSKGKSVVDQIARPCPTCGDTVLFYDTVSTGTFWKCIDCKTTFADDHGKPAQPELCTKCGGKSVTRHHAAHRPGTYFWACGTCRRAFEDVDGKAGRCFDDIDE